MELQLLGANCVRITTKEAVIVIDDTLTELGKKSATGDQDIALVSNVNIPHPAKSRLVFDAPGEYEASHISITGIPTRLHIDETGSRNDGVIYRIVAGDFRVVSLGHTNPILNEEQLERIGVVDVLFVPVGGFGFTIDPNDAASLIKKIEPRIVIPTHYKEVGVPAAIPQHNLEEVLKALGMEPKERTQKLRLKQAELPETTTLIVLEP